MNRLITMSPILALMVLLQASPALGQFPTLVRHLPKDANTMVLFNVQSIMATPLAQKEGWRENHDKLASSGLVLVPPDANQFVLASQMDIEVMEPRWSCTVMNLTYEPSMMKVVQRYGGNVDQIDGQEAAILPNDTFVVKFGKSLAGTMFPADRQKATRWVQSAYSSSNRKPLGEYLTEAEGYASKNGTPIILAMDFQHVFSPSYIRHKLDFNESVKGKDVDLDQLAKVIASIRGVTLGITITDKVFGGLKVDFSEDVTIAKEFAKPLLLEVLGNQGAMINEFNDWTAHVSGKQVLLRGPLYRSGLQRICTVLDSPADLRPIESSSTEGETNESLVARTTLQYWKMLNLLLDDITKKRKTTQTQTAGLVGMWYKQYASKIDAMPILNVDPEMLDFGSQVSGALRQAQNAMQGVGVEQASGMANMEGANVVNYAYGGRAGVGRYGGVGGAYGYRYQSNPRASLRADGAEIARIKTNARIKGYGTANQITQNLEIAMADMRKKMTLKYQIEF